MKKTAKLFPLILAFSLFARMTAPLCASAEESVRGAITAKGGAILAYTDPETGARIHPFGDLAAMILGTVHSSGRGVGGVEESMDSLLYPSGQDMSIQLTLDLDLQRAAEDALNAFVAQSASSGAKGSAVIMDMQGRVLAMASADQDPQATATNNAIAQRSAPGELFMIAPALAALTDDRLTLTETISDEGRFSMYSFDNPARCWIDPGNIRFHANQTVVEALQHNCYYYFYELASRLGSDGVAMQRFAQSLGLMGRTGIELPDVAESFVAGQSTLYTPSGMQYTRIPALVYEDVSHLIAESAAIHDIPLTTEALHSCVEQMRDMAYAREQGENWQVWRQYIAAYLEALGFPTAQASDAALVDSVIARLDRIKYGGTDSLETAVGQSITQVTPLAMARYMTTLANGGYVYAASIVKGVQHGSNEAQWAETPTGSLPENLGEFLPYIHMGLRGVVDHTGKSVKHITQWKYLDQIASMVSHGRDYETGEVNSLWYAGFAPYDRPEIVVVVNLLDGDPDADEIVPVGQTLFEAYLDRQ